MKIKFYDVEVLDGYFSGILDAESFDNRYILELGFDIEFKTLELKNCNNYLYTSGIYSYKEEEIEEFRSNHYPQIIEEINNFIDAHGYVVFSPNY